LTKRFGVRNVGAHRLSIMKIHELFLLAVLSATAGCEGKGPIAGPTAPAGPATPPAPAGPASPAPTTAVRVEGRVLNGDNESPVAGAIVRADRVWSGILLNNVTATTDAQGRFSFTVEVSAGWRELSMSVTRNGFEPNLVWAYPGDVTADLRLVPSLVIRPGETIEVGSFVNSATPCFIESALCRRVLVEGPPGEAVDLEVFPVDQAQEVRLAGPLASQPFSVDEIGRKVTTSRGEVHIVPLSLAPTGVRSFWGQRVTLKAQRRAAGDKP
jgi:hypothetical protein